MTFIAEKSSSENVPPARIKLVEDHDEAYYFWKERGFRNKTLIHFDAHIDLNFITPSTDELLNVRSRAELQQKLNQNPLWNLAKRAVENQIHIGNYVYQALKEGIVQEFIWVYPDDPDTAKQYAAVEAVLKSLMVSSIDSTLRLERGRLPGSWEGSILSKCFKVMPYSAVKEGNFPAHVLVDIDVDFFIVRSLHHPDYPFAHLDCPKPWLAPPAFVRDLQAGGIEAESFTISYSVEEGYTPLGLKFLGEELSACLQGKTSRETGMRFEALHKAYGYDKSEPEKAIECLENALKENKEDPNLLFNLALLYLDLGEAEKAKSYYEHAIAGDPSYRTRYNHPGPVYALQGDFERAAVSYEKMCRLDPDHPYYRLFDVENACRLKRWNEALDAAEALHKTGFKDAELFLYLAESLHHLGRQAESWSHISNIASDEDLAGRAPYYWMLRAKIAAKLGRLEDEIASYQELVKRRIQTPFVHASLSRAYLRKGNAYKARTHALKALRLFFLGPYYACLRNWKMKSVTL